MTRRSFALSPFLPLLMLGVICGSALWVSGRQATLCLAALVGCIAVLACRAYSERIASLCRSLLSERAIDWLRSPGATVGLGVPLLLTGIASVLWPEWWPWVFYLLLALLAAILGCGLLRLGSICSKRDSPGWAGPARWTAGGAAWLSLTVLMELAPGDIIHGLGGAEMGSGEMVAIAAGIKTTVREEAEKTREIVRREGEQTRKDIQKVGTTTDEILAVLERIESRQPTLVAGSDAPPERPPLSDEDRAILDAAKPSADALTRYRIAVAEGDDRAATDLEPRIERLLRDRRAEEDFLYHRARGDRHFFAGRFDEAVRAYQNAYSSREDDPDLLNRLGLSLFWSRSHPDYGSALAEAQRHLERSLAIVRSRFKGDRPDIASILNNLASVMLTLGRAKEAEQMHREALDMRRRLYTGDHPDIALSLNNLATVMETLGRPAEAEPMYREALDIYRGLYRGDHPDIARGLNNLAAVMETLGHAAEAEPMYTEALDMRRRIFGTDHSDIASSLNNLGSAKQSLGLIREAEPLYQESLDMYQRLFKGDHPHIARALSNLASAKKSLGRITEAELLYQKAVDMYRRLFGGDHSDIARALNNLAGAKQALGNTAAAASLYQEALDMYRRLFDGDHPDIARALNNLAGVKQALGDTVAAESMFHEALDMRRRLYTEDHPDIALSLNNLASVKELLGKPSEAETLYQGAVEMAHRILPKGHPHTLHYEKKLALIRNKLGLE